MGPGAFRLYRPLSRVGRVAPLAAGHVGGRRTGTLRDGLPDLASLLARHALTDPWKIRWAPRWCPVRYVVFDLLYHGGQCLLREPLRERRARLAALCAEVPLPEVIFSAGVVGAGRAWYEAVVAQGHEGMVAEYLTSPYQPGRPRRPGQDQAAREKVGHRSSTMTRRIPVKIEAGWRRCGPAPRELGESNKRRSYRPMRFRHLSRRRVLPR